MEEIALQFFIYQYFSPPFDIDIMEMLIYSTILYSI